MGSPAADSTQPTLRPPPGAPMTATPVRRPRASRYQPLADRLANVSADSVTLPVDEIEGLCGGLPAEARRRASWWANDHAHAQARAWMDLGFQVAAVDPGGAVRFARRSGRVAALEVLRRNGTAALVAGRLDRRSGTVQADRGGAFLLDGGFVALLPRGARGGNRVRPAAGEAFLLACWFSLRGTEVWGRLLGWDGKPIPRDEGLAMIAAYRAAGAWDEDGRAA
jgi:hypothetical protein